MFGIAQTIESGRWFQQRSAGRVQRLQPHIPDDHKQEINALADAIGWDQQLVRVVNVFPELFHCSGFAVFGKCDRRWKAVPRSCTRLHDHHRAAGFGDDLYRCRRRQDPVCHVGYAGFIGSVSGMNARGVSLGEMGGRGEGAMGRRADGDVDASRDGRMLDTCGSQIVVDP